MRIVRKAVQPPSEQNPPRIPPWKLLVVDDEEDVRRLTTLNLRGFEFAGRGLDLIEASSAAEAMDRLREHGDIAAALIDVVMETDDAGLKLVEYIRNEMHNRMIRLIIRTGQPGVAPERYVIDNFDIDDYKDKTELTVQRLYTTLRTALKGYRDLQTIELNRLGLARILDVTPELYDLHRERLEEYFRGVLMQIIGICNLEHSGMIFTIDGLVMTMEGKDVRIRAGTGEFRDGENGKTRREDIVELCTHAFLSQDIPQGLRQGAMIVPLKVRDEVLGFIYLESQSELTASDQELIQVMANQCASALDNFRLHHSLEDAYDEAIDMLGHVAEFKDSATGSHIRRIQEYTRRIARALGSTDDEADSYAKASRLHDVGKVGIPDDLLRKPGKLTADEFTLMKRHTLIGDAVLSRSPSLAVARTVAKSHHEHWDGSGYPNGLAGTDIPYAARLVAVADVFDALVSRRPYKEPWHAEKAVAQIAAGIGSHFDPQVAEVFLRLYRDGALEDLIAAATEDEDGYPDINGSGEPGHHV
jgi:HD-GYP domain-containing protein (c-di-GMP phosphodiesterase class II)/CheY-like chemotaxis protein